MIHGLRKREDTAEQFDKMYLDIKDKNKAKSSLSVQTKVLWRSLYCVEFTGAFLKTKSTDISDKKTPVCYLEDLGKPPGEGIFYREWLVRADMPDSFPIEIIKTITGPKNKRKKNTLLGD